jgi:hypothetical protein
MILSNAAAASLKTGTLNGRPLDPGVIWRWRSIAGWISAATTMVEWRSSANVH